MTLVRARERAINYRHVSDILKYLPTKSIDAIVDIDCDYGIQIYAHSCFENGYLDYTIQLHHCNSYSEENTEKL